MEGAPAGAPGGQQHEEQEQGGSVRWGGAGGAPPDVDYEEDERLRLLAFEPHRQNFRLYNASVHVNGLQKLQRVVNAAVTSDGAEPLLLYQAPLGGGDASVNVVMSEREEKATKITEQNPVVVKIRTGPLAELIRTEGGSFGRAFFRGPRPGNPKTSKRNHGGSSTSTTSTWSSEAKMEEQVGVPLSFSIAGDEAPAVSAEDASNGTSTLDFLKIDTEGRDHEVVRGAVNFISAHRPRILAELQSGLMRRWGMPTQAHSTVRLLTDEVGYSRLSAPLDPVVTGDLGGDLCWRVVGSRAVMEAVINTKTAASPLETRTGGTTKGESAGVTTRTGGPRGGLGGVEAAAMLFNLALLLSGLFRIFFFGIEPTLNSFPMFHNGPGDEKCTALQCGFKHIQDMLCGEDYEQVIQRGNSDNSWTAGDAARGGGARPGADDVNELSSLTSSVPGRAMRWDVRP